MAEDIVETTPIEDLPYILGELTEEQRQRAKARMRSAGQAALRKEAREWRERQRPRNMKRPTRVRIRSWRDEPIVGAVQLLRSGIPGFRKILPGEVVVFDLADPFFLAHFTAGNGEGQHFEVTMDPITRPLVFDTPLQADVTNPVNLRRGKYPASTVNQVRREVEQVCRELENEVEENAVRLAQQESSAHDIPPEVLGSLVQERLAQEEAKAHGLTSEPTKTVETDDDSPRDDDTGMRRRRLREKD